jgi:hypothetical protein
MRWIRVWFGAVLVLAAAQWPACGDDDGDGGADAGDGPATVQLSGVAYTFNTPEPLEGVTISIAELPDITAVSDADGRFSMEVPNNARLTPVGQIDGYMVMHLQTFTSAGRDIEDVFLQMVTEPVFDFMAGLIDADPDPSKCQLVTTVNTREIRGLTYEEFAAFGHHGVPDATASSDPALGDPVYFNDQTIPDPSLTATTIDGGVVWTNIEPGVYTVSASHPSRVFDSFVATCEPGRFINANPPWGLRER